MKDNIMRIIALIAAAVLVLIGLYVNSMFISSQEKENAAKRAFDQTPAGMMRIKQERERDDFLGRAKIIEAEAKLAKARNPQQMVVIPPNGAVYAQQYQPSPTGYSPHMLNTGSTDGEVAKFRD